VSADSITIGIKRLKVTTLIGMLPYERKNPQEVRITLRLTLSRKPSDAIETTVDYAAVAERCRTLASLKARDLIETLATDILDDLQQTFPIQQAFIRVEKPSAIPEADYAFVELERRREL
jgi:dihydroneopterin aldolase